MTQLPRTRKRLNRAGWGLLTLTGPGDGACALDWVPHNAPRTQVSTPTLQTPEATRTAGNTCNIIYSEWCCCGSVQGCISKQSGLGGQIKETEYVSSVWKLLLTFSVFVDCLPFVPYFHYQLRLNVYVTCGHPCSPVHGRDCRSSGQNPPEECWLLLLPSHRGCSSSSTHPHTSRSAELEPAQWQS